MARPKKPAQPAKPKLAPNVSWRHGAYHYGARAPGETRYRTTKIGTTEADVYAFLATLATRNDRRVTMDALFDAYEHEVLRLTPEKAIEQAKRRRSTAVRVRAASTVEQQLRQLVLLRDTLGGMVRTDVQSYDVGAVHDALAETRGAVTANRVLSLLRQICTWGVRKGYLKANPCADVRRFPEDPRTRYITDVEFAELTRHASPWLQVLMEFARIAGQRESNLIAFKRASIRADGWHFPSVKRGRPVILQPSSGLRAIALRAELLRAGIEHKNPARVLPDNLILSSTGSPLTVSGLQSAVRRLKADYEQHCLETKVVPMPHWTFHDLRAKAGSDGSDENLLGHQNPATFRKVYARKPRVVKPVE